MRMKTVEQCSSISLQWQCSYTQEPINDWIIAPQNPQFNWSKGGSYPRGFDRQIQVPELQYVYPQYDSFRFRVYINDSAPSQWLTLQNDKLVGGNLLLEPGESTIFKYGFQSLDLLPAGEYVNSINIVAFGVKNGAETELTAENIYSSGAIKISVTGTGGGGVDPNPGTGIRPEKTIYRMTYNKQTAILSGDINFKVLGNESNKTIYVEDVNWPIREDINGLVPLAIDPRDVSSNNNIGVFKPYDMNGISLGPSTGDGIWNLSFRILDENRAVITSFPVELTKTDGTTFEVSPGIIIKSVDKSENSTTEIKATLSNPNNLNISVSQVPEFIQSVNIVSQDIKILIKPGTNLTLGNHEGDIIFSAGNVSRKISVKVTVVNFIQSDFSSNLYYFALDKRKIKVTRSSILATKVYMKLDMFFSGYGEQYQDSQEFQLSFFQGIVEFDPGKEVHDFFIRNRALFPSNDFISFALAQVSITLTERNDSNEILNTYNLPKLYFAPGKKPKCFPLFTDHPVRRTFPDSKISLSTDIFSNKTEISQLVDQYTEEKPAGGFSAAVKTYNFVRNKFKPELHKNIIANNKVQLIPIPAPQNTVHVFWENQNLVMDWFSASEYNTRTSEFENVISTNYKDGRNEKYDSLKTKTLQLQTGWFLEEERELIDDLMASRFCIIEVKGKIYKALPNGKKNPKPSDDTTHSVILEFELIE
ncbi:hypothetical protein HZP84_04130 [Elizabethkingia anophelis]|nr:hypothetical protein [Elizabethkingia anophelis]